MTVVERRPLSFRVKRESTYRRKTRDTSLGEEGPSRKTLSTPEATERHVFEGEDAREDVSRTGTTCEHQLFKIPLLDVRFLVGVPDPVSTST